MKTKKQNKAIDKRLVRRREKTALNKGIENPNDKNMGKVVRHGWGSSIVSSINTDKIK